MKSTIFLFVLLLSQAVYASDQYFPYAIFSKKPKVHAFLTNWYETQLKALNEKSVFRYSHQPDKTIYRFTCLRTFHRPIAIRIELQKNGEGVLFAKMTNGAGGYDPGELIKEDKIKLSKKFVTSFKSVITEENYWNLPTNIERMGLDGSQWIVEGKSKGKYHIVHRWTPGKSESVYVIGLHFIKLSGLQIKELY